MKAKNRIKDEICYKISVGKYILEQFVHGFGALWEFITQICHLQLCTFAIYNPDLESFTISFPDDLPSQNTLFLGMWIITLQALPDTFKYQENICLENSQYFVKCAQK